MKNILISNLKLFFLIAACFFIRNISVGQNSSDVCQGQTGVTYCVPTITDATGYLWALPAGATIATGVNTNSITVDFSNIAVSGNITVQGTNSCGSGTVSANFEVTVSSWPVAAGISANGPIAFCEGDQVILSGNYGGIWSNGMSSQTITVTTSGDYFVINSNACGSVTSNHIIVTVSPLPAAPANQIVCAGNSVSFTATAQGMATTYQWRKGTVNLTNGGNISGATSAVLIIDPVNIYDAANDYNVVVTGTCPYTSLNICLGVNNAPLITTEPEDQTANTGNSASFFVTATGSDLTYQWRKGTINLIDGGTVFGATSDMLTIDPVNINDTASNYNVLVSGTCLPISISADVSLSVWLTGMNSFNTANDKAISIYPNPFAFSLNIFIHDAAQIGIAELRIYNVLGEVVINTSVTKQLSTLDTRNLSSGIYSFIVISKEKIIQSGKLISYCNKGPVTGSRIIK